MKIREEILKPGYYYHIYNRGVNSKSIFLSQENYRFFLLKVEKYILPYFDVYAYCLMPNHFHLILSPKTKVNSGEDFRKIGLHSAESVFSKSIGKLISSYTQAFNKVYLRTGALLESPFKRIEIDNEEYLKNSIIYVHQNHNDFKNYKFSSYRTMLSTSETKLMRQEVLSLFGDLENFIYCHNNIINFKV